MNKLDDPYFIAPKASVSCAIATAACYALQLNDPLSAAFVALVCVSPSAWGGLRHGIEQLVASALGGAVTFVIASLLQPHSHSATTAAVFLSMGATIFVLFAIDFAGGYLVAGFTTLYLLLLPFASPQQAFSVRMEAVLVGVFAATAVNLIVSFFALHYIVTRRLRIARAAVAEVLRAVTKDTPAPHPQPVFSLLSRLGEELEPATHERISRGAARLLAEEALAETTRLNDVLHAARSLALVDTFATPLHPTINAVLLELADALEADQPGPSPQDPRVLAIEDPVTRTATSWLLLRAVQRTKTTVS